MRASDEAESERADLTAALTRANTEKEKAEKDLEDERKIAVELRLSMARLEGLNEANEKAMERFDRLEARFLQAEREWRERERGVEGEGALWEAVVKPPPLQNS